MVYAKICFRTFYETIKKRNRKSTGCRPRAKPACPGAHEGDGPGHGPDRRAGRQARLSIQRRGPLATGGSMPTTDNENYYVTVYIESFSIKTISVAIGCVFGRWDIFKVNSSKKSDAKIDP